MISVVISIIIGVSVVSVVSVNSWLNMNFGRICMLVIGDVVRLIVGMLSILIIFWLKNDSVCMFGMKWMFMKLWWNIVMIW